MKSRVALSLIALLCTSATVGSQVSSSHAQASSAQASSAQASSLPPPAPAYTLREVLVVDRPSTHMWMVDSDGHEAVNLDGDAFRSLASPVLRQWVSGLPVGSVIVYTPSSLPIIGRAFGDESGLGEFMRFCRANHVQFCENPTF